MTSKKNGKAGRPVIVTPAHRVLFCCLMAAVAEEET